MTLLFPQPFGPTMPTNQLGNSITVGSAKLLKPEILTCLRRMYVRDIEVLRDEACDPQVDGLYNMRLTAEGLILPSHGPASAWNPARGFRTRPKERFI